MAKHQVISGTLGFVVLLTGCTSAKQPPSVAASHTPREPAIATSPAPTAPSPRCAAIRINDVGEPSREWVVTAARRVVQTESGQQVDDLDRFDPVRPAVTTDPDVAVSTFAVIDSINARSDIGMKQDDSPLDEWSDWNLDPGNYIVFGTARRVTVDFEGTCLGTGQPVSGVVTSWDGAGEGALSCDEKPSEAEKKSTAATQARTACP